MLNRMIGENLMISHRKFDFSIFCNVLTKESDHIINNAYHTRFYDKSGNNDNIDLELSSGNYESNDYSAFDDRTEVSILSYSS